MRYFFTLLIIFSVFHAWAQQVPVLERSVTLTAHNERLDSFLKRLSHEAGCVFSYSASALDVQRNITYQFNNETTREILETVFDGQVRMKQKGVYVILTPLPKSSREVVISGYVVDEASGDKVESATVYNPVTLRSVTTDQYGYFEFNLKKPTPDDYKLIIKKVDYVDTVVVAPQKRSSFQKISIKIDKEKLNNVGESIARPAAKVWAWTKNSVANINLGNVRDTIHRTWQVSFVPFVGTNRKLSGSVSNDWSFNILGGYSAGTNKAELGGLFNINNGPVKSVQVAGFFNADAGFVKGFQLAGFTNINLDSAESVQLAGFANINEQSMKGVQLAGFINIAGKDVIGSQVAGFGNIAGRKVSGSQIAGFFNVAHFVNGTQIGFINIADSVRGVPIGFMSFVASGYHTLELGVDEILPVNISFRTGVRGFYNILTVGTRPEKADTATWAFGYGVGSSPRLLKKLFLNIELVTQQLNKGNVDATNLINRFYLGFDYQLARKFAVYAGPTLTLRVYDISYNNHPDLFTYYKPTLLSEKIYPDDNLGLQLWWGFRAGIRVF